MKNDTTITMNKSMVNKIFVALRYGMECARERKRYEGLEAQEWGERNVDFPFSPDNPKGFAWVSELVRREQMEQTMSFVYDLLLDVVDVEAMS